MRVLVGGWSEGPQHASGGKRELSVEVHIFLGLWRFYHIFFGSIVVWLMVTGGYGYGNSRELAG